MKDSRPISVTSILSKVCERYITDWFIESRVEFIDIRRFGSIPDSPTTHALISLVHRLVRKTDGTMNSIRLFILDFSKAFTLIDHAILIKNYRILTSHRF